MTHKINLIRHYSNKIYCYKIYCTCMYPNYQSHALSTSALNKPYIFYDIITHCYRWERLKNASLYVFWIKTKYPPSRKHAPPPTPAPLHSEKHQVGRRGKLNNYIYMHILNYFGPGYKILHCMYLKMTMSDQNVVLIPDMHVNLFSEKW